MKSFYRDNLKYKLLTFDELVINLDRITRFKLPEESYFRVFSSLLYKNLIYPKFSKVEIQKLPTDFISFIVEKIWNESVLNIFPDCKNNFEINRTIKLLYKYHFKNIDNDTKILINTNLLISPLLTKINYENAPENLKFLIKANEKFGLKNKAVIDKMIQIREKYSLLFPIDKLLIVEGITEEILLPVFADKLQYNFNKNGVYVLGAGGKSKSPDIYLKLKNRLNIPIILLFDNDAHEICELLQQNLLKKDKTVIIKKGEFEDILSLNLLKRAINAEYDTIKPLVIDDLKIHSRMCDNIENYYKTRKLGEFKKSKLSKIIAKNVKYNTDITVEIKDIINELRSFV